ncbi:9431_t:CDS:2, partial [Gigaspora margarita]
ELCQDCLILIYPFSAMSLVVIAENPKIQNINPDKYFNDDGYIEAHDSSFTFVNPKYQIPSNELQELINTFKNKIAGSLSKLIDALKRRIGVHHTGLPRKYLDAIEILFQK